MIQLNYMKKYLIILLPLIAGLVFLSSCRKEKHKTKYITLNETVKSGIPYSLDVSAYGDEDDQAVITTQAFHYGSSQIDLDAATSKSIYHFTDDSKYKTGETVVITLSENHEGRSGGHCDHDEAVITIHFTIL